MRSENQGRNARTGAEAAVEALSAGGVEICFTNPGTSEMHFVAALDRLSAIKPVLGLAEGVVTGAADGYARIAGKPAATLLHLGPGLANGIANLHNAHRANTPVINIVGDHALDHVALDAPLTSDIESLSRPFSKWYRSAKSADSLAGDCVEALAAANERPKGIATLVIPADCAWTTTESEVRAAPDAGQAAPDGDAVRDLAARLKSSDNTALLIGGDGLDEATLGLAAAIRAATGTRILAPTFVSRMKRGQGVFHPERIPYFADMARNVLDGIGQLVLLGARKPVPFFAYPGQESRLVASDTEVLDPFAAGISAAAIVAALADEMGLKAAEIDSDTPALMPVHDGPLTPVDVGASVARHLPMNAIIVDEAITAGVAIEPATLAAPAHDWLELTGGAIGWGLPAAVGAALAAPERKVVALEADGSAMYTLQALWTAAREGLDILAVILANRSYFILNIEFARVGAGAPGDYARDMLNIDRPALDFVALAQGMGVEAAAASTAQEFDDLFKVFAGHKGPRLIEARIAMG